ncbi:MAG: oligogalacturonate lyase family protein [Eubacteriales bacterium]|nr:oligogalacturonate lyase family protein [Eubacteriales bacterium]MDD3881836.1 oligogalacturonate lyase family protein [Eubacteriales bacterium]MDD4512918.1 oligogalacturonate lyase family protein [Eubacteriales bacterium]
MNQLTDYRDAITGYAVRKYTVGPERNSKLYFTSENFSPDDKYFYFNKQQLDGRDDGGLYRGCVATGELERITDTAYRGFAMDREKNIGYTCRNETEVCTVDLSTNEIKKIGDLPEHGQITGHLTAANSGRVACSYHLANKIYALVVLDPETGKSEIVYQSDYRLGHAQICPSDENLIFYIHETEGDAFQRTWMYDVAERYARPYYVEHPNEWITHEVWAADGSEMAFMKLRGRILIGDKDGRHFDQVAESEQLLHPCLSRDKKWLCADRISYLGVTVQEGIVLIERATGKAKLIATTGSCKSGADHQHPSFNRSGDMIFFNNPDENGIAQVCTIDLGQVKQDW